MSILDLHRQLVEASAHSKRFFFHMTLASAPIAAGYFYFFFLDFFSIADQGPVKFLITAAVSLFMCLVCGALVAGDVGAVVRNLKSSKNAYLSALRDEMERYGIDPETVVARTAPHDDEYVFTARLKGRKHEFSVTRSDDNLILKRGGQTLKLN